MTLDGQTTELELLKGIDEKLGALLTITLDSYVRSHGIAGARPKAIDQMLFDAGMSTAEIATLLNKTQRAVQKAVSTTKPTKAAKTTKKASKKRR
jgi:hypothetical protein